MMTPAERVMAALQGQPVDRRPFAPLLSHYGRLLIDCDAQRLYTDSAVYVAGQRAVIDAFAPDLVYAPFALSLLGAAFGGDLRFLADQAPNLSRPGLRAPQDLEGGRLPCIEHEPHLRYLRDSLRGLVAVCGDERPVAAISLGPVDLPIMFFGLERWLEMFLFEEDEASRVLEITSDFCVKWTQALLADGAACVVMSAVFAVPEIITPELFREVAWPWMRQGLAAIEGPVVLHHGGARLGPYLPYFTDLPPNVAALALDQRDDPLVARRVLGAGPALAVGPDSNHLATVDEAGAAASLMELLRSCADDPALLAITSGPDVSPRVPVSVLQSLRRVICDAA